MLHPTSIRSSRVLMAGLAFLLIVSSQMSVAQAAISVEQRRELTAIKVVVRRAGQLVKQGQVAEAADLAREARERLTRLVQGGDSILLRQAKGTHAALVDLQRALASQGIALPAVDALSDMAGSARAGVRFSQDVAPVLVTKCGRCHIQQQRGDLDLGTFASLMKGTPDGRVVIPKDAEGSRLIEVIESGAMPKGGGKLSAAELAKLKQWISAGAALDGKDQQVRLTSLAPAARPAVPPALKMVRATGNEKVLFSRDIAPVLDQHCAGCHGNGQPVRARLNLTTFRGLLRGGDNGPPLAPGKAAESLLVMKLKGTGDGKRMPSGRPPLDDATIAEFETWINEGAAFDRADVNQNIGVIAAMARAEQQTHDELAESRAALAEKNWQLVMPGSAPEQLVRDEFLLLGSVDATTLGELGSVAESLLPRLRKIFRIPTGQRLVKGRITLYFFASQYDYGEFGQMVEKRELPAARRAHWRFTTVDAYAALYVAQRNLDAATSLLAEQLAGIYVASLGESPAWFSNGVARATAARLAPQDTRVLRWNQQLAGVLAHMKSASDFLTGRAAAEDADVAAYSFAKMLMSDTRRFQRLLAGLREGHDFDQSFVQSYGASPEKLSSVWASRAGQQAARGSRRRSGR